MSQRIVSLLPSATETLFAMGLGDRVVARSHACDQPPEALQLPAAMRTRVETDGTSREIDGQVQAMAQAEEPMYVVDEGVLHHVQPDLIVAQDTCQVCAAGPADVQAALMRIEPADRPEIVTLHAHGLEGVFEDMRTLGDAAGAPGAADGLIEGLRTRVEHVRELAKATDHRPDVLVLDWLDPPMVAGHWVPEMVELAGGRPVLIEPGQPSSYVDWEAIVEASPEVLILAPCGFDIPTARREASALTDREGWAKLPAVRDQRVHLADADRFFSRPGPSLVDALEMLATAIHPDRFASRMVAQADRLGELG